MDVTRPVSVSREVSYIAATTGENVHLKGRAAKYRLKLIHPSGGLVGYRLIRQFEIYDGEETVFLQMGERDKR